MRLLYKWPSPIAICSTIGLYVTLFSVCHKSTAVRIRRDIRTYTYSKRLKLSYLENTCFVFERIVKIFCPHLIWKFNILKTTGYVMHKQVLTFNNCTLSTHCIYLFCVYLRTNSDLCHLHRKLIGFYNRDEKCLQHGTHWVFKQNSLPFVFKGLICICLQSR